RTLLLRLCARNILWRNADDLHTSAAGNVHRVDDVAVLYLGISLHENDLLGTGIVDLLELTLEVVAPGYLSRIDRELAARLDLEDDLIGFRIGWRHAWCWIRKLNVDRLPHRGQRRHEDDQ